MRSCKSCSSFLCSPFFSHTCVISFLFSIFTSISSLPLFLHFFHFERTRISCSHYRTTFVFCSQFSQEPGSGLCFQQPDGNLAQSTWTAKVRRLEVVKKLSTLKKKPEELFREQVFFFFFELLGNDVTKNNHWKVINFGLESSESKSNSVASPPV